ncbi:hypothetical protein [Parerythrobacter lacustris]|uniref:Uncharacterized protein n=1 Tax=Parerythrobacter lacustris TaxID=2969984 RepID=A0ABT1XMY2_9SPHN|nr:hypothetical protein [Parerythrobacter lacustris]MCR2833000.1 hypothetical protein [Parerythrobacter lacustris]
MIALLGLFYAVLVGALLVGQWKVVSRAIRQRQAGLGRFTYARTEAPFGFWTMLILETVGLLAVALYTLGALESLAIAGWAG